MNDDISYPWEVRRVPNYDSARSVAVEDAARIDESTFTRRYVLRNQPCLIKGAVVDWPAFEKWRDAEYLISKIGEFEVQASCKPKIEGFGLRSRELDRQANAMTQEQLLPAEKVRFILQKLLTPDDDVLFMELRPAQEAVRCLGDDLASSSGRFPFLRAPRLPRFGYSGWAAMFYKNSYSDWHFHPGTEAVMCQVLGTKDVLLLPPTKESWDQIVPTHVHHWKVYDVDVAKAPAFCDIRPYHVVVEPGDGLYLPVNWWHAVQGRRREYGITVPVTWESPYRDLRQPATRHFVRRMWKINKSIALVASLATMYGTVRSCLRELST